MKTITPQSLAAELVSAAPPLTGREQHLSIGLYRLLAEGEPVEPKALADRAELTREDVDRALATWPGVFTDERNRVVGYVGLSIRPTPHQLTVDGRALFAWCALDTLFLPELLGSRAEVESRCPSTGEPVTLAVEGTDVSDVRPAGAVLSYVHRDEPLDRNVINTFCRYIHFFANPDAAAQWTAQRDNTFAISLADGREIAHRVNRGRYPSILGD